jgi:hypothetical protein
MRALEILLMMAEEKTISGTMFSVRAQRRLEVATRETFLVGMPEQLPMMEVFRRRLNSTGVQQELLQMLN